MGRTNGVGGMLGEDTLLSAVQAHVLLALDGWEVGVSFPDLSEKLELLLVAGVDKAGESALRKSV